MKTKLYCPKIIKKGRNKGFWKSKAKSLKELNEKYKKERYC